MTLTVRPQEAGPTRSTESYGPAASGPRWLCPALAALGFGVALLSILGPLATGAIDYHVSPEALNQITGGDLIALVLVAPACFAAAALAWRRHPAAPVVALGPAVFAVYTTTQLTLGGDMARYTGNSERFFALDLAVVVLGIAIALASWAAIADERLPPITGRSRRALAWFLLFVAGFVVMGLHLPTLLDAWRDIPTRPEYLADPGVFWLVKLMDLGIVAPTLIAVGIGLLRGARWAHKAVYAVMGWFALLGSSVAAMAIVMQRNGDPAASVANTIAFTAFASIGLVVAARLLRPLLDRSSWT